MKSRVIVAQHPLHPMLVPVPVASYLLSLTGDLAYHRTRDAFWFGFSTWTMRIGTLGALAAAVPGLIDYATLVEGEAKRPATLHMVLNLGLVGVFGANLLLRAMPGIPTGSRLRTSVALTVIGNLALLASAWLGGHLVYEHRIGVQEPGEPRPKSFNVTLAPEEALQAETPKG